MTAPRESSLFDLPLGNGAGQAATPLVGPYAEGALLYRAAGWSGVLPMTLPPPAKKEPPKGYTGRAGRWPDDTQIERWRAARGANNLALRPPDGLLGIDVDHYGSHRGADTIARLEAHLGPLAPTWRSSARSWPSGIRWFRVPTGRRWRGAIEAGSLLLPNGTEVEVPGAVQLVSVGCRYAVVWPSVHEVGPYGWWQGDDETSTPLPAPDDIDVELGAGWCELLTAPPDAPADNGPPVARRETVWADTVQRTHDAAVEALRHGDDARHEVARQATMRLARYEERGYAGATAALDALRDPFVAAVTRDPGGRKEKQRRPDEAEREWRDLLDGARQRARTTAATAPSAAEQAAEQAAATDTIYMLAGQARTRAVSTGNGNGQTDVKPAAPRPVLDDDFWSARPELAHIRQAAHARQRSAETVLHATLARLAAIAPHTLRIPAIVGAPAPLSYFAAIVGAPGTGKSSGSRIAGELVPAPAWVADDLPVGSGEGIAEVLFELVTETGDDGKPRQVKRQTRHNAYMFVDEGDALFDIGGRKGSTLLPTLRSVWFGLTLGQTNASAERRRIAPAFSYVYGLVMGMQPARAARLLDDAEAGTPARFAWASAHDPNVPDTAPGWPGPLDWSPPPTIDMAGDFEVSPAIDAEVRAADLARTRREVTDTGDPLDAHSLLLRLKIAGLLAVLNHAHRSGTDRRRITDDDWSLAGQIKARSDVVRASLVATVADDAARRENATRQRLAGRAVAQDKARDGWRVAECAQRIRNKVTSEPSRWTRRDLYNHMRRWRDVFEDGLDHALGAGWVVEVDEPSPTGDMRRNLRPKPPA